LSCPTAQNLAPLSTITCHPSPTNSCSPYTLTSGPDPLVSDFLKYFPNSSVYQATLLTRNKARATKIVYSLKNFPCPYRLPGQYHVHGQNHPYILYSPCYTQKFRFLYVGCHCEPNRERVSALSLINCRSVETK